ncbi:MAG TPA: response regulator transcription factor [Anaerolineae bacterium]|nr:response regulator transcription factor [Anaerolineae bacterium]
MRFGDLPGGGAMNSRPVGERSIRICVADRQMLVRRGICALLAAEPDIEVVGEAGTLAELADVTERQQPDVVVIDALLFPQNGGEALQQLQTNRPAPRVLVLTHAGASERILAAIKAGAAGFLLKNCEPGELTSAVRAVQHGDAWLHPAIARQVLDELAHPAHSQASGDALTEREMDVLRLLAHGYSNRQIAYQLTICEGTVRVHVSNILSKLHIANRTQAALYALREGLASVEDR